MVLLGVACKEWLALCSRCSRDYEESQTDLTVLTKPLLIIIPDYSS